MAAVAIVEMLSALCIRIDGDSSTGTRVSERATIGSGSKWQSVEL